MCPELGSAWYSQEFAKEFPPSQSPQRMNVSAIDDQVTEADFHIECTHAKEAEKLCKAMEMNWVYEHFRLPEFVVYKLNASPNTFRGLEALVDFLISHPDPRILLRIVVSNETIPWLYQTTLQGPSLDKLCDAVKQLKSHWSDLKKTSRVAIEEALFPLACHHFYHSTPEEFFLKIRSGATLPTSPHPVFKLKKNGEVLNDYNRLTCCDKESFEFDFVFFNPRPLTEPHAV